MKKSIFVIFLLFFITACPNHNFQSHSIPIDLTNHLYLAASLGPGDIFEVRVYQDPKLSGKYRVTTDGIINFPLIGIVYVNNKTPNQVAKIIREKLAKGYINNPYVTVYVLKYNSKKIFILGQVQKPGTFVFEDKMNIVQAISLAGGFTKHAKSNSIIVTRKFQGVEKRFTIPVQTISKGMAKNFILKPGDIIFVPESIL